MKIFVEKKNFIILLFLFFLTFFSRLMFVLVYPEADFSYDVKSYYLITSANLLEGKGFQASRGPLHYTAPFYSVYLASVRMILGDSYLSICLSVFFLDVLICFVLYLTALRIFNEKIALFSCLGFALYPPLIKLSSGCNLDILLLLFVSLSAYFLVKTVQERRIKDPVLCGIFIGLASLTKPVTLLFPFFLFPWLLVLNKKDIKKGIVSSALVLASSMVIISPWIIRNYLVFHKFIAITTGGNTQLQNRTEQLLYDGRFAKFDPELAKKRQQKSTFQALKDYAQAILSHPFAYIKSIFSKSHELYFKLSSRRFVPLLFLMQAVVLGFSLVGMFRYFIISRGKRAFPVLMVIAYFLFVHTFLVGSNLRYGMQTIPFLFMFGIYEVVYIIKGNLPIINLHS